MKQKAPYAVPRAWWLTLAGPDGTRQAVEAPSRQAVIQAMVALNMPQPVPLLT